MIIRPSVDADAEALAAIYGHYVLHGLGTFEEIPPSAAEMLRRRTVVLAHDLPYVVAERDGKVVGYAYASVHRPRSGYRFTVEDSVYVAPDAVGQGLGKAMLSPVIEACEIKGMRQVVAVIGDSGNAASVALHASLGFQHSGVCKAVGFKHGRWVDTVWMQKYLNGGDTTAPEAAGLVLTGS